MFVTLIIIVFTLLLIYWYLKIKYFTRHGPIPGLPPEFFFGNLRQTRMLTRDETVANVHMNLHRQLGDIYQFWIGPSRVIVVSNADDIQHIFSHRQIYELGDLHVEKFGLFFRDSLICSKGEKYKRHARLTMPILRRGRIIQHFNLILDCTDKLMLDQWRSSKKDHIHTDIMKQCEHLFMIIFGHIGFNYDLEMLVDNAFSQALHDYLSIFKTTLYMPEFMNKIYLKFNSKYQKAKGVIQQYLDRMIDQEQNENDELTKERTRTSLIASLVNSMQKDEEIEALKSEEEKKGLSRNEIINEMLLLFVGGFETTSAALTWFIHLMSKNPHVQTRLKAELANNPFSMDRIDSLIYLDAVIREVLRFGSPSIGTFRTLMMDDRLPATEVQLYKGDQLMIPTYNVQYDRRYWKIDPKLFCPERFLENSPDENHHPCALIPFGGGHRQCIGQDLARFELKTIAARLMQYVTFGDGGPNVNSGGLEQNFTTGPRHVGVTISFD